MLPIANISEVSKCRNGILNQEFNCKGEWLNKFCVNSINCRIICCISFEINVFSNSTLFRSAKVESSVRIKNKCTKLESERIFVLSAYASAKIRFQCMRIMCGENVGIDYS